MPSPKRRKNIYYRWRTENPRSQVRFPKKKLGKPGNIVQRFRRAQRTLSIISLNSDHTNGTSPKVPRPRAMVADNDLALGSIVERITKSKVWANSLILVTEDDA